MEVQKGLAFFGKRRNNIMARHKGRARRNKKDVMGNNNYRLFGNSAGKCMSISGGHPKKIRMAKSMRNRTEVE